MKKAHNQPTTHLLISFCILCSVIVLSCKNQSNPQALPQETYAEKNAELFSVPLNVTDIDQVELNSQTQNATADWLDFLVVKSEMDKFKSFSIQDLVSHTNHLTDIFSQLNDSIPQKFITKPVESRINVLITQAKTLQQYIAHQGKDTAEIRAYGKSIYTAYQNLKIQLNEIYLSNVPDFEMRIDQVQDSIINAKSDSLQK